MFSTELRVALSPERTYRKLLAQEGHAPWWKVSARPALLVVIMGIVMPMMAFHRVTFGLAILSAAWWSVAVVMECIGATCIIASAGTRQVGIMRALDLWFAGYLPFGLWLLTLPIATMSSLIPALDLISIMAVVPLIWTAFIAAAYCRTVLGTSRTGALCRTGLHLAAVVIVASTLFVISAGGGIAVWSYVMRRLT